ncbi:MAG: OmpA family protein [Microscillaceae bacterium]|nr:OmpA family protein [Microscillaceae bacterium]
MSQSNNSLWSGLRWPIKATIIALPIVGIIWGASYFNLIPGIKSSSSLEVNKFGSDNEGIDSKMQTSELPILDIDNLEFSEKVKDKTQIRLMNWIWFGNAPIFAANGGLSTMKESLMEKYNVNLKMITNNSVADMKREQLAFIQAYAKGDKNPSVGVHFVTIMGDGAPAYISAMNEQIEKAFGKEYKLKIIGNVGFSMGEDCLMGPKEWKDNPQNLKGSVISAVIGDGDWALVVRYAADNGIPVNPDPTTYDPEAVNFIPAPDDDFLMAAQEVIAKRSVSLKEKDKNGNLTGKTVTKDIQGAATWFPGDIQMAKSTNTVKIVSTTNYPNQMATVLVGCDQWMKENSDLIVNFLSASLISANQIKEYPNWFNYACQLAPKVFCANPSDCDESADDWKKFAIPNGASMKNKDGLESNIGGTQMANLADNIKYYGIKGGNNYYKSVYDYFANVIETLNPFGFMDNVKALTPYEDAVDLSYLGKINIVQGTSEKIDYSQNKGETFATKNWQIQFRSGSDVILPEGEKQLLELFNSLNIAETARVKIVGHTDADGNPDINIALSLKRAKAVKKWLIDYSKNTFPSERFSVDGLGSSAPVADNNSEAGKAKNRRVEISLIQ